LGKPDALSWRENHQPLEGAEQPLTMLSQEQFVEISNLVASDKEILL
jgi:hypothetical protein